MDPPSWGWGTCGRHVATGGNRFADYLDDFRVYGVTLSAADITNIYGSGNGDVFPVTAGSSYATATATLVETGGADTTVTVVYDSTDKGITSIAPISSNLSLWLDASELTSAGATWTDKSGNNNSATKNGSPTVVTNAQNGLSVMRYSGANSDYHEWADLTDIRTIFWVIKANSNNAGFLLGDDNQYHFHHNDGNPKLFWHSVYTSSNIRNGNLRVNGQSINGLNTQLNSTLSSLSIISLKTTGNVEASRFSNDRNLNGRNWNGDLGELLIFNTALTDSEIMQVEGYLADKWNLNESFPNNHPYRFSTSSYYTSSNA